MEHLEEKVVALYSREVEYIASTPVLCQGVWIARLVTEVVNDTIYAVIENTQTSVKIFLFETHNNKNMQSSIVQRPDRSTKNKGDIDQMVDLVKLRFK